jgi:dsDNA-binding SOS-regulon protein
MEYTRNTEYGKTKCFRCLLSPDREEAAIFMGINKVISRALDTDDESVYPCKVLNRFACPYDDKVIVGDKKDMPEDDDNQNKSPDVNYLFRLSEMAFAVELALAKAQEEDSAFRIKSAADAYNALTNRETLKVVLQQGLKEEHIQYKDKIVEFLMKMKDRIKIEDMKVY